jgi:LysM repeat protein
LQRFSSTAGWATLAAMRPRILLPLAVAAFVAAPAPASADFAHVVTVGESLSSIAAADGLTVAQLAAANGISAASQITTGSTVLIPPQSSSSSAATGSGSPVSAGSSTAAGSSAEPDGDDTAGGTTVYTSSSTGSAYVVQPGDTLSAIASRAGVSAASLAAANGLDPNGVLLSGRVLRLSGSATPVSYSSSSATASGQPVGAAAAANPGGPPYPTAERVSGSQVGQIAAANGVSPSLAQAIGWQESGFNNDLVSSAGARGVMQIMPGTWDWINRTLTAGTALAPASAASNVTGGVLLLHSLLNSTGGDPAQAAAGYYQGLSSVHAHGMYNDTQQYVNSVMALEQRFASGG